jgi:hypothetical protein
MLHWFAGYGNDGFWSAQNSAQSIAKNPLSSKKQSKTKSSVNSTKKASSSSSTPSKKVPNTSDTNLPRVVKQFRLNAAHSLPADSTKLFHAFFVPGDGNCLFHSFKSALHLMSSVSILRRQVVDLISDESDPMKRLSTMNAHIAREQEFHNPAYHDVELLDAGSIHSPGQMDIRFSTLWAQYSDEMLSTAWAGTKLPLFSPLLVSLPFFSGEPEIMALCELLNVNCVVWELRQQYAEVIFQFQRPGRNQSIHLHYASRRHYEYTDIPKVNLFQFFKKHLAIFFTYIFSGLLSSCCSCSFLQKNFSPATTKSIISINKPFSLCAYLHNSTTLSKSFKF